MAALIVSVALAIDNGLGLRPPLGWRSFNAYYVANQTQMEDTMDLMVDRSRLVDGVPTSLLDLGYSHVGLDGGWNYCFAENHTFHTADGTPVWNDKFPNPQAMVDKAKKLKLKPGWYLNNCGCAENHLHPPALVETIYKGSVRALHEMGWDGVKFDSCSQFHNLTHWADLINATGRPVLIENCHQGGYAPGMVQWQAYLRNATSGAYTHELGYFVVGSDEEAPMTDVTADACQAECTRRGADCVGICFQSDESRPSAPVEKCYVKKPGARYAAMDLSNNGACTGLTMPSNCPYNFFRTSGECARLPKSTSGLSPCLMPFPLTRLSNPRHCCCSSHCSPPHAAIPRAPSHLPQVTFSRTGATCLPTSRQQFATSAKTARRRLPRLSIPRRGCPKWPVHLSHGQGLGRILICW